MSTISTATCLPAAAPPPPAACFSVVAVCSAVVALPLSPESSSSPPQPAATTPSARQARIAARNRFIPTSCERVPGAYPASGEEKLQQRLLRVEPVLRLVPDGGAIA